MIAQCPQCGARYELDEDKFSGAGKVRGTCKKCGTAFSVDVPTRVMQAPAAAAAAAKAKIPTVPAIAASLPRNLDGATVVSKQASDLRLPDDQVVSLSVISGPAKGQLFRLTKARVIVGRSGADVTIPDPEISRQHCAIEIRGPKATVVDLGTTNGTFVDGKRVEHADLQHLNEFHIGQSTVMLTITNRE